MKKYSDELKQSIINQAKNGISVTSISKETGVARNTIYSWLNSIQATCDDGKQKITMRQYNELQRKLLKLQNMIHILQSSGCSVSAPLKERLTVMESLYGQYEVRTLCEAFCVSRGTFYNHMFRGKHGNTQNAKKREELRCVIRDTFHEYHELFGSGKITAILRSRGFSVSEKLVSELMYEMDLKSVSTNSKRIYNKWQKGENKNILQQRFYVKEPNRVWVSDITAFKYKDTYYYIAAIIDLFSRKVIAYKVSKRNSTQLITSTFRKAYADRNPSSGLVFHSDRGAQYTSLAMNKLLYINNVEQSFSKTGCPHDNAVMESFFSYLKREELYRRHYTSEKDLLRGIDKYIAFYNEQRPHGAIQYKAPSAFEKAFYHTKK